MEYLKHGLQSLRFRARNRFETEMQEREYRSDRESTPFQFLERTDPNLAQLLGREGVEDLRDLFSNAEPVVYDLGSGSNPTKGTIFFDAVDTIAVDPAYAWYEYQERPFSEEPFPYEVFGGKGMKDDLTQNLKAGFKELRIPEKIEGRRPKTIHARRNGKQRKIELVPQRVEDWVHLQDDNSLENIVMWRAFPPSDTWGKIIASLKTGGYLITSGYGIVEGAVDYEKVACGVDVYDSPLPQNGNTEVVGLTPLTNLFEYYFYQKTAHLPAREVAEQLRQNLMTF